MKMYAVKYINYRKKIKQRNESRPGQGFPQLSSPPAEGAVALLMQVSAALPVSFQPSISCNAHKPTVRSVNSAYGG